jgi:hypothetical protein
VKQFVSYFANYFGIVGTSMGKQLFSQLCEKADKVIPSTNSQFPTSCSVPCLHYQGAQEFSTSLADEMLLTYKPLVSALYMWQRGTMRDQLVLLFDIWDTNPKDGRLSKLELAEMVRACSRRHTASACMMMEALHLDVTPIGNPKVKAQEYTVYYFFLAFFFFLRWLQRRSR